MDYIEIDPAKAADHLESHRLLKMFWRDEDDNCCTIGAIMITHPNVAFYGESYEWEIMAPRRDQLINRIQDMTGIENILEWNDSWPISKEDAVKLLRSLPVFRITALNETQSYDAQKIIRLAREIASQCVRMIAVTAFNTPYHLHINTVKEACEEIYGYGFADEVSGDVECGRTGHFYRVDRWIVVTDSQGFSELLTHETEDEAKAEFNKLDQEYALWDAQGDD